jgi:hypothetical protein
MGDSPISSPVLIEFLGPKASTRFGAIPSFRACPVSVPKTPVDEDDDCSIGEIEIWDARERLDVSSVVQAYIVENCRQSLLRCRMSRSNCLHELAAFLSGEAICHVSPPHSCENSALYYHYLQRERMTRGSHQPDAGPWEELCQP